MHIWNVVLPSVKAESYPGFQKAHSVPSFGASESLWQKVQDLLLLGTSVHFQLVLSPQTTTAIIWEDREKGRISAQLP